MIPIVNLEGQIRKAPKTPISNIQLCVYKLFILVSKMSLTASLRDVWRSKSITSLPTYLITAHHLRVRGKALNSAEPPNSLLQTPSPLAQYEQRVNLHEDKASTVDKLIKTGSIMQKDDGGFVNSDNQTRMWPTRRDTSTSLGSRSAR